MNSSHVRMWELDYKASWALKNWCFWNVVLEKALESPLDCKEIQPVHPKGDQSWVFIGRTDAEAETPILWPPDAKSWLIGKDPNAGKEEKGTTGWDGWMASPTQWTWVWVNFGSWWWTGRPGMLRFMGSQTVRHNWATELNWNAKYAKEGDIYIIPKHLLTKYLLKVNEIHSFTLSCEMTSYGMGESIANHIAGIY